MGNIEDILSQTSFHSIPYIYHNKKRLEHLESLILPIVAGMTVLEVGAGVGDLTSFFIDKGCLITSTEGREECFNILKQRIGNIVTTCQLNLENPMPNSFVDNIFDIVFCYGTLYHLSNPEFVIEYLSKRCGNIFLLETCVSYGANEEINLYSEDNGEITQSISGFGCRPTRTWLMTTLKKFFEFVYVPITQPQHLEFPEDWLEERKENKLYRSIFVCSRKTLDNPLLSTTLLLRQQKI